MRERVLRCEECDDLYSQSALDACSECDMLLCASCEFDHDCSADDEEDDDIQQPDPLLAARESEAARIYAEMEAARTQFYGSYDRYDDDNDPTEGRGALAWGLLSLSTVLAILAVWALIQAAHGGAL